MSLDFDMCNCGCSIASGQIYDTPNRKILNCTPVFLCYHKRSSTAMSFMLVAAG